ncbi:hypothetical protein [Flavobacterium sp. N1736]|uniref:hypothetical protein n=1 Tax=Flavobacterium sp. N1736 TaxID=2986823 RepID=UPI0022250D23|nr:hypothetical protein [Flavobacterium sp. N1736]
MNDKYKLIEYFYTEALKHEVNSEEFLKNSKQITKLYREHFGLSPFWLEYHKYVENDNKESVLRYLEMMIIELRKIYEF